jgi:hypothetical protein
LITTVHRENKDKEIGKGWKCRGVEGWKYGPNETTGKSVGPCICMPNAYTILFTGTNKKVVHCIGKQTTGRCIALVVNWFSKKQVDGLL